MKRRLHWLFIKKANIAPVTESISCPVGVEIKEKEDKNQFIIDSVDRDLQRAVLKRTFVEL